MIDKGLPSVWPANVKDAARRLRLGFVFDLNTLFYLADTRLPIWVASYAQAEWDAGEGIELGLSVVDLTRSTKAPPKVILTSQTCDIGEESEPWEFPWVQVAPVYAIADDDPLTQPEYYVRLTAADIAPPGNYVADLRLEMPIEKGVLAAFPGRSGFATEEEEIRFAEVLGRRRQRPAVASEVNRFVRGAMRDKANGNRKAWKRTRQEIHKVLLAIEEGSRLSPRVVRLIVVSPAPLSEGARKWFEAWYERARDPAFEAGLTLAPSGFMDNSSFDVRVYDSLLELDVTF